MVDITKNRNFFKRPKLLYFKPESLVEIASVVSEEKKQSVVEIGSVVSEKIFFNFIPPFF
jgi:hypothetical protein